jgi:hypothetical protein
MAVDRLHDFTERKFSVLFKSKISTVHMLNKQDRELIAIKQIIVNRNGNRSVYELDERGKLKTHPNVTIRGNKVNSASRPFLQPPRQFVPSPVPSPPVSAHKPEAFRFELNIEPTLVDSVWNITPWEPIPLRDVFAKTWEEAFADFAPFSKGNTLENELDFDIKPLVF